MPQRQVTQTGMSFVRGVLQTGETSFQGITNLLKELLATDAVLSMPNRTGLLMVVIDILGTESAALYLTRKGATATELADQAPGFSVTKDTASSVNIYYENGFYKIQNKLAVTITISYWFIAAG